MIMDCCYHPAVKADHGGGPASATVHDKVLTAIRTPIYHVMALISDLLRDPTFREKYKAFNAFTEALTLPPVLALPVWTEPFTLSTDASEIRAGAVLTQCIEGVEKVIAYGC